jgi:hypothetical protein
VEALHASEEETMNDLLISAVSDGDWPPKGSTPHEQMLLRTNFLYYKLKCLEDALREMAGDPNNPRVRYKPEAPGGYLFNGSPLRRWGGRPGSAGFRKKCRTRLKRRRAVSRRRRKASRKRR